MRAAEEADSDAEQVAEDEQEEGAPARKKQRAVRLRALVPVCSVNGLKRRRRLFRATPLAAAGSQRLPPPPLSRAARPGGARRRLPARWCTFSTSGAAARQLFSASCKRTF
jgi:hypothetical protein